MDTGGPRDSKQKHPPRQKEFKDVATTFASEMRNMELRNSEFFTRFATKDEYLEHLGKDDDGKRVSAFFAQRTSRLASALAQERGVTLYPAAALQAPVFTAMIDDDSEVRHLTQPIVVLGKQYDVTLHLDQDDISNVHAIVMLMKEKSGKPSLLAIDTWSDSGTRVLVEDSPRASTETDIPSSTASSAPKQFTQLNLLSNPTLVLGKSTRVRFYWTVSSEHET